MADVQRSVTVTLLWPRRLASTTVVAERITVGIDSRRMVTICANQQTVRLIAMRRVASQANRDSLAVCIDRVRQWTDRCCDDDQRDALFGS